MKPGITVSDLRVHELLTQIGGDAASPGAGVAAAVALALAAACAHKAVSISLKHQPESVELRSALVMFRVIETAALADGDRDASAFEAFIREKGPSAVDRLVCEEEQFGELIAALQTAINEIEARIQPNITGDIFAARALAAAAQQIQQRNERETLGQT